MLAMKIAPATTAVSAANSGSATRRTNCIASVLVIDALISVTADTGDIVRPAAEPTATTAPTSVGSTPSCSAGTTKKPNRLVVVAMPEPEMNAKPSDSTPAAISSSAAL